MIEPPTLVWEVSGTRETSNEVSSDNGLAGCASRSPIEIDSLTRIELAEASVERDASDATERRRSSSGLPPPLELLLLNERMGDEAPDEPALASFGRWPSKPLKMVVLGATNAGTECDRPRSIGDTPGGVVPKSDGELDAARSDSSSADENDDAAPPRSGAESSESNMSDSLAVNRRREEGEKKKRTPKNETRQNESDEISRERGISRERERE